MDNAIALGTQSTFSHRFRIALATSRSGFDRPVRRAGLEPSGGQGQAMPSRSARVSAAVLLPPFFARASPDTGTAR